MTDTENERPLTVTLTEQEFAVVRFAAKCVDLTTEQMARDFLVACMKDRLVTPSAESLLDCIADLRIALMAASGILAQKAQAEGDEGSLLAHWLLQAAHEDSAERKLAVRALEKEAGYVAGTGRGEATP